MAMDKRTEGRISEAYAHNHGEAHLHMGGVDPDNAFNGGMSRTDQYAYAKLNRGGTGAELKDMGRTPRYGAERPQGENDGY